MTTRTQFRIPDGLYEELKKSAKEMRRSVNAELVARLESTFGKGCEAPPGDEVDEAELKPCPFCGSEALVVDVLECVQGRVECNQCGSAGPWVGPKARDSEIEERQGWESGELAARQAWNRRA